MQIFLVLGRTRPPPRRLSVLMSIFNRRGVCRPLQLVLEYERGPWSLRLASVEEVDEVIAHIGSCLHRIRPAGSPA